MSLAFGRFVQWRCEPCGPACQLQQTAGYEREGGTKRLAECAASDAAQWNGAPRKVIRMALLARPNSLSGMTDCLSVTDWTFHTIAAMPAMRFAAKMPHAHGNTANSTVAIAIERLLTAILVPIFTRLVTKPETSDPRIVPILKPVETKLAICAEMCKSWRI